MVSTRGVRYKFCEGERVLCYEPDPTKAKVLYDSKVVGILESKNKRGKNIIQYKIHFQGWNSSWDRRVDADFVLKDTNENRQLQRDLAEKAQLQLRAAYLYRRENRKRPRSIANSVKNLVSEEGHSCIIFAPNENEYQNYEYDSESSSVESVMEEGRLHLKVGDKLKKILDYDFDCIKNQDKLHILPVELPAVTILEKFVRHYALKMISTNQTTCEFPRSKHLPSKGEGNFETLNNTIFLLKEIADSLRVYLNFTLRSHLLYDEEKDQAVCVLSDDNFKYMPAERLYPDLLNVKEDLSETTGSELSETQSTNGDVSNSEECNRRKLRSHRTDTEPMSPHDVNLMYKSKAAVDLIDNSPSSPDNDSKIDGIFLSVSEGHLSSKSKKYARSDAHRSSIASISSVGSVPCHILSLNSLDFTRDLSKFFSSVSDDTREILHDIFYWQLLSQSAPVEASMIYGAVHLIRLLVKLPDFLNAAHMSEEKLYILAPILDSFVKFMEVHTEWYDSHLYKENNMKC